MPDIDYWAVEVPDPDDKPRVEWHYTERRAELLREVIETGNPYTLNQGDLAERYGVAQSTISKDLDSLNDAIEESLGKRAAMTARATVDDVVAKLDEATRGEDADWRAAQAKFDIVMRWNEYLADIGAIDVEPDRAELDVTQRAAEHTSEDYRIIPDDADISIEGDDAAGFADAVLAPEPDEGADANEEDE